MNNLILISKNFRPASRADIFDLLLRLSLDPPLSIAVGYSSVVQGRDSQTILRSIAFRVPHSQTRFNELALIKAG